VSVRDPVFGCDLSTSRLDAHGYAYHGHTRAHIAAWTAENGAVSDGKVLDHICRRRNCMATIHLEPVTQSENEKRKRMAYRARIKLCPRGHSLDGQNRAVTPEGGVTCRVCNQAFGEQ